MSDLPGLCGRRWRAPRGREARPAWRPAPAPHFAWRNTTLRGQDDEPQTRRDRRGGRGAAARRRHRDARRRARRLPRRRVRERPGKPSGAAGAVSEPSPFPWDEAMTFGLGRVRWSPQEFWRATPRELAAAAQGLRGDGLVAAPSARDLAALTQAFPD